MSNKVTVKTINKIEENIDFDSPSEIFSLLKVSVREFSPGDVGINISFHPMAYSVTAINKANTLIEKIQNKTLALIEELEDGVIFEIYEEFFETETKEYYRGGSRAPEIVISNHKDELDELSSLLTSVFHEKLQKMKKK